MYETKVIVFNWDSDFETTINQELTLNTEWQLNYMLHVPDGDAPKIVCTFIKIKTTTMPI
jgi:hypothetical protein